MDHTVKSITHEAAGSSSYNFLANLNLGVTTGPLNQRREKAS